MIKAFILLICPLLFHPVHVTMSGLTQMPDKSGFELVVRIYSDDLAIDLWRIYQPDEDYFKDHRFIGPDSFYENYINDNLLIKLNGKLLKAELSEVELLELETVLRLEVPSKRKIKSLAVENRILTGLFSDQVNLFIYKDSINEKAIRFTVENNSSTLVGE